MAVDTKLFVDNKTVSGTLMTAILPSSARKSSKYLCGYGKIRNFASFSGMRGSERAPHFLF